MTIKEAQLELRKKLAEIYEVSEANQISHWVMESLTGMKKIDRLIYEQENLSIDQENLFIKYLQDLLIHRPVQYVLGEAYFFGHKFFVKEGVLIPRPETEELVDWVVKDFANQNIDLLDVGTGSGCIPISLSLALPKANIHSVDISPEALQIAQINADNLQSAVNFLERDFLKWNQYDWENMDVLISNPPYIPTQERSSMDKHVTAFEPSLALFVPDESPLIFYEALAGFGKKYLKNNGAVYVEIHEDLGASTYRVFEKAGYHTIELRKDLQGRDRMIKAELK